MDQKTILKTKRRQILDTAAKYGAVRVRVFGSVARGNFDSASDLDFLVDLAPDRSLFDLGGLHFELSRLLGVDVDVVTPRGLRKRIRDKVLAEAVDL